MFIDEALTVDLHELTFIFNTNFNTIFNTNFFNLEKPCLQVMEVVAFRILELLIVLFLHGGYFEVRKRACGTISMF